MMMNHPRKKEAALYDKSMNGILLRCSAFCSRLFADGINNLYAKKCIDILEQIINSELYKVSKWLLANKLSLNISRQNFLLICSRKPYRSVKLESSHTNLNQENYTNYLGVMIDEKLNWRLHIKYFQIKYAITIKKSILNYQK